MGRGKTEAEIGIMLWQVKGGVWPPEAGRGKEVSLEPCLRESTALPTPWFGTSSLHTNKKRNFCCF